MYRKKNIKRRIICWSEINCILKIHKSNNDNLHVYSNLLRSYTKHGQIELKRRRRKSVTHDKEGEIRDGSLYSVAS